MGFGRCLAVVLILLTVACASTEPLGDRDPPDAVMRVESERIVLQARGGAPRLTMQLRLACDALPCRPQDGVLVFVSHRSDETYLDEHTITIAAGGVEIAYPGPAYGAPQYRNRDLTEQITVPIAFGDVRQIAQADSVIGRIGPTRWTLSYERRRSLRSIVRQLEP